MAEKTSWADKYNALKTFEIPMSDTKVWKCSVEEHKTKGTLQLNVRQWTVAVKEGGYSGVTKNGFILPITDVEDLDKMIDLFKQLQSFCEDVKTLL